MLVYILDLYGGEPHHHFKPCGYIAFRLEHIRRENKLVSLGFISDKRVFPEHFLERVAYHFVLEREKLRGGFYKLVLGETGVTVIQVMA